MIDTKRIKEIVSEDNQAARYLEILSYRAYQKKIPFQGTFELTPICNFDCPMCYVHLNCPSKDRVLPAKTWIDIANSASNADTLEIILTGGEPLMHPEFKEIYTALHKMGMIITIMSNASLMDDDFFDLMEKYPPRGFSITIYGNSPETYAKMCGRPDAYEKVKKAILRIKAMKNVSLKLKTTVTKHNVHDIPELIDWAEMHSIRYNVYTYLEQPRSETERSIHECALSVEEEVEFWKRYQLRQEKKGFDKTLYQGTALDELNQRSNRAERGFCCTAASNRFWITWEGKMLACAMLAQPTTYPLKDGFDVAYKDLVKQCSELPGLGLTECNTCDMRGICTPCPARHYLETGRYGVLSQRVCQRQKLFMEHQCYFN